MHSITSRVEDLGAPLAPFVEWFALARRLEAPIWVYDIDNCCVHAANAAAVEFWQAPDEATLLARDLGSDMTPTVASRLRQYQKDFDESQSRFNELWTIYPNGVPTSAKVVFSGCTLDDGRTAMLCEVVTGAERENPETLRCVEALLHTDVMISLYAEDGQPLYMNPAARKAIKAAGQTFSETFASTEEYMSFMFELDHKSVHRRVVKSRTAQGIAWHDVSVKRCADAATGRPSMLVTAIDVSELKNARDQARFLADRDVLTGCFNRSFLQQHMTLLSKQSNSRCAAVYFDIDHFKQLNDQFGHELGDAVLKEISERARGVLRDDDLLVRLGGDEFVVIFHETQMQLGHAPELDRLRRAIAAPIFYDVHRLDVTVSLGAAVFHPSETDYAKVLREADMALYKSKFDGRNRWTIYTPSLGLEAEKQRALENEIKIAIEKNQFALHYQPRVDLATGKIVSAEALVRWNHPTRGLILPDEFIPKCEETGMILELGQIVLHAGCEQAIKAHAEGWGVDFSINISPRQFEDSRLMDSLEHFAARSDFPKGRIELEITENVLIGDLSEIEQKLGQISQMGYAIAVDDFGTGYSNLSYISKFPINCLKIDRSFVQQLPEAGPIISLILTLAQQIGAKTVAEGVESESDAHWLLENACDQAQGFFFAKPLPLSAFKEMLMSQGQHAAALSLC